MSFSFGMGEAAKRFTWVPFASQRLIPDGAKVQPKILENGAMISDGSIADFDGNFAIFGEIPFNA